MIFGILKSDNKVFSGDKINFDARESFLAPGISLAAIPNYEFSVDAGVTWYDISAKKVIDWVFTTIGTKTVSLKITTTTTDETFTKDIEVLDLEDANLFSNDDDLISYEPDVYKYLPKKWSSWNSLHYEAQKYIVQWLDDKAIFDKSGNKYAAEDILDIQEVREFSMMKVLELIFRGNSNQAGDIFSIKADEYKQLLDHKASKAHLRLDFNKNGESDLGESTNLMSVNLIRQ